MKQERQPCACAGSTFDLAYDAMRHYHVLLLLLYNAPFNFTLEEDAFDILGLDAVVDIESEGLVNLSLWRLQLF